MKKLILFILVLFSISTVSVFAEEPIEDISTEEVIETEETGFFESIVVGIYEFVTSDEFNKLAASLFVILGGLYPFYRKWKDNKYRLEIEFLKDDADAERKRANNAEKKIVKYEKLIEIQTANTEAITDSLIVGFDKSNLREDAKDKVLSKLRAVPKLTSEPVLEKESVNINEEKDNLLTEAVEDTQVKTGW